MLVHGEKIKAGILIMTEPELLLTWQKYRPEIIAKDAKVENLELIENRFRDKAHKRLEEYFGIRAEDISNA